MRIIAVPSENFNERADGAEIKYLVMHHINLKTFDDALDMLTLKDNRLAPHYEDDGVYNVSAHYLIDTDGTVYWLVDEDKRAWHAGTVASWGKDREDINSKSIGIEFLNPGRFENYLPFTPEQIAAGMELSQRIIGRHDIKPQNVLAHSDIAPERKADPGHLFPWQGFAHNGIGLWPEDCGNIKGGEPRELLREIGYNVDDYSFEKIVEAFRRRFMGKEDVSPIDADTAACIARVAERYRCI